MQLPEFLIFFTRKNQFLTSNLFWNKNPGCNPIHFDAIFPMKSSEYTKSLNYGSISTLRKNLIFFIFHLIIDFIDKKIFFLILNTVYCDRSELDHSDGTIRIQNSEKCIAYKLSQISIPNFNIIN